jgi:hypothetical protein
MSMPARTIPDPPPERALLRLVEPTRSAAPDLSIRTCTSCGEHTAFVRDQTDPGWYVCSACGAYA